MRNVIIMIMMLMCIGCKKEPLSPAEYSYWREVARAQRENEEKESSPEVTHKGGGTYRVDFPDSVFDGYVEIYVLPIEAEVELYEQEPNGIMFIPIQFPLSSYEQNPNGTYTVYEDDTIMVFTVYTKDLLTVDNVTETFNTDIESILDDPLFRMDEETRLIFEGKEK